MSFRYPLIKHKVIHTCRFVGKSSWSYGKWCLYLNEMTLVIFLKSVTVKKKKEKIALNLAWINGLLWSRKWDCPPPLLWSTHLGYFKLFCFNTKKLSAKLIGSQWDTPLSCLTLALFSISYYPSNAGLSLVSGWQSSGATRSEWKHFGFESGLEVSWWRLWFRTRSVERWAVGKIELE